MVNKPDRSPALEFAFGFSLGVSLVYLLLAGLGFLALTPIWPPEGLTIVLAYSVIMYHERFWLAFKSFDPCERPYQLGTTMGALTILALWFTQFH